MNLFDQEETSKKKLVEESKRTGYDSWLKQPLVRASIATIPTGASQDILESLLKSAYEHGHSQGQAVVLMDMVKAIFKDGDRHGSLKI
jgi:hypothetical protein